MKGVAFFDVDHTLVSGSTAVLCAGILRRERILTRADMLRVAFALLRHRLGVMDAERAYAMGVKPFVGMPFERGNALLQECWREHVRPRIHLDGLRHMQVHRRAGEGVVLLSASSRWLLESFREVAPLDDILAFRQRVRDGRFVDEWDRPVPYGANKRTLAERYAAGKGVDLADCTFYSDSSSDRPLLEAVGHPVAVNPDPWLRRVARRRGWTVETWTRTLGREPCDPADASVS